MNITTADTVVRHFFDETGIEQVPVDLLQQFVQDYPYVAAGHLLLAKKLFDRRADNADAYANTANIYLHDPLLLDRILSPVVENGSGNFELSVKPYQESISNQESLVDNHFEVPDNELSETERSYLGYSATQLKENNPEIDSTEESKEINTTSESEFQQETTTEYHEEVEQPVKEDDTVTYAFAPENYGVSTGHSAEHNEFEITSVAENSPVGEIQDQAFDPQFHESPVGDEPPIETAELTDIPSSVTEETAHKIDTHEEVAFAPTEPDERAEPTDSIVRDKLSTNSGEIKLEPYYTVDYFASQGIRLQTGDLGKDSIGKQLKSFTDWLRAMKKLPSPTDSPADEAVQQSILRIAAHSIEEKEVITETMAEVWAKQGNIQRAMDIYNKLSLQNPSKSHYFAAKIEQLKSL
jgi:hypothetical protein